MEVYFEGGVYLPTLDLWLDSRRKRELGYISHAHADHIARHKRAVLSTATGVLLQPFLKRSEVRTLEYGEVYDGPGYTLTLHPAGHCLGSAMALVRCKATGERLLYTGDFRVESNPTAAPMDPVPCDTLVMECTFGRPDFVFPPQDEVLAGMFSSADRWLEAGGVPVVLAYRTGKAQELLHHLLSRGYPVAVEPETYEVTRRYEEAGVVFPGGYRAFDGTVVDGEVLVFPPGKAAKSALAGVRDKLFLGVSGWAVNPEPWRMWSADEWHAYSDHADFPELVDFAQATGAREVYTVFGFPELASRLRSLGMTARHLTKGQSGGQIRMM